MLLCNAHCLWSKFWSRGGEYQPARFVWPVGVAAGLPASSTNSLAKQRDLLAFDFKMVDFGDSNFPVVNFDDALLHKARIILFYSLSFSSRVAVIFPSQPAALTNPTRNFSLQQAVVMNVSCAFL